MYDSKGDTLEHIHRVSSLLGEAASELIKRGSIHDNSKLEEPEKPYFDECTPLLKNMVFGTKEYKDSVDKIKPALDHHYANNSHHPQFYEGGVNEMNMFDLIEMFFDWKASGERGKDGNIYKSIDINAERFGISKQLKKILENTAKFMQY